MRNAPVVQLDRASDSGSECWGFESLRAYHKNCLNGSFCELFKRFLFYFPQTATTIFQRTRSIQLDSVKNVAVAQPCLDIFRVTPAFTQGVDYGMAQVMETDDRKANFFQSPLKLRGYAVWPDGSPVGMNADKPPVAGYIQLLSKCRSHLQILHPNALTLCSKSKRCQRTHGE